MRRILNFTCEGIELAATLDGGPLATGLLIVSGGNEIRIGAHRGMARLATAVAAQGHAVFRFDRRGVGDSEGENAGFASSGADIRAAVAAFRSTAPHVTRVVAFGNCDAATALVLHRGDAAIDALVLGNPWVVEPVDDLPPPAAIKDRYARRLRDPAAWAALLTGKIDMRALGRGLGRLALPRKQADLATSFADALVEQPLPTAILLAARDGTALAFSEAWNSDAFAGARDALHVAVTWLETSSHSFANEADFASLSSALIEALAD